MHKYGWKNVRGGDFCTPNEEKLRFLLALNSNIKVIDLIPIKISTKLNLNLINTNQLFTLKCNDNCYFIGRTNNLVIAILNEYNGLGSEWTKIHLPIELISTIEIKTKNKIEIKKFHNEHVIYYMKKFGFQNIRGGDFFNIDSRNHKNKVLNYTDIFKVK